MESPKQLAKTLRFKKIAWIVLSFVTYVVTIYLVCFIIAPTVGKVSVTVLDAD